MVVGDACGRSVMCWENIVSWTAATVSWTAVAKKNSAAASIPFAVRGAVAGTHPHCSATQRIGIQTSLSAVVPEQVLHGSFFS